MAPKSIFKQPGAQHFQLVHRSQRDPLIHDPDASQHVLKAFVPSNTKRGKSRAELETPSDVDYDVNANIGEASLYGIYYDDTEYDYMQHLRAVGVQEEGVDSILIEAPSTSKHKPKVTPKKDPITVKQLIAEALPSTYELPRNFESQEAVPSSIAGFRPDMDPHLRQTLEALEDDAFMDDGLEDDFFGELVGGGERGEDEEFDYEFEGNGVSLSERGTTSTEIAEDEESWEARFAKFKKVQPAARNSESDSDLDINTEGGDTVSGLPKLPVIGGKRRRKGTSDASGYSMSSSSIFRTKTLLTLDERFDQLMIKEYGEQEGEQEDDKIEDGLTGESDEAPDLITSRDDFEAMMDDFLDNYELLGRKMKPVLPGDTGLEKLDTFRRTLGQDERVRIGYAEGEDNEEQIMMPFEENDKRDRWDCETILTTYSNLENHPRMIQARDGKPVPKIKLDPRTGLPTVGDRTKTRAEVISESEEEDGGYLPVRKTATRPRGESKDDKKARKQAVKLDQQTRRVDKKATKERFSTEMKHQLKGITSKESKLRKL